MYLALNRGHRVLPRHPALNGAAPLDRFFDGFFDPVTARALPANASLAARFDVVEKADRFEANIEIPGVAKDEIDVQIEGATVRVKAEPKAIVKTEEADATSPAEEAKVLHSTRVTRSWFRNFTLPVEVDEARAEAAYQDGVLTLTLPKKEVVQPKRVAIK
jgi:HSP20 family protein